MSGRPRHGFAGTAKLLRLILRLDRIKLTLWLLGLITLIGITPSSVRAITESEAENQGVSPEQVLAEQAILLESNGASLALQGPADALETFGGRYAFEIGAFTLAFVALMNILLIGRHTRAEEESGRAELVRAAAVGPWSSLAAVGILATIANLVLGGAVALVFMADGQEPVESLLYGASLTMCGLVFAAIALVWVQVFEYTRPATGMSLAVVLIAFAIRAVGDVRDNWLVVLSPLGWVQSVNAFGDPQWWPFATAAVAIAARRDVGAGLVGSRPGPPTASGSLTTPLGFAWRLQQSTLLWWTVGAAAMGGVYGSVISAIEEFAEQNEGIRDMLEALGMAGEELRNGFITVVLSMIALIATGGVIQTLLRPRTEEVAGRAEPVLGTAIGRRSWLSAHVLLTLLAAPLFMAAAGLAMALADAAIVGGFADFGGVMVAALARVPALWAVGGIGVLLYGWARRFTMGVWAVFVVGLVVFLFGELLRLPDAAANLSPINHVTHLPGGDQSWLSVIVLTAIGLLASVVGLVLFDRRDIDSA